MSLARAVEWFFDDTPITVSTLRNAIRKGKLKASKVERKLLVTESWLAEWLDRCRVQANNPTLPVSGRRQAALSGSSETERVARAQACASDLMTHKRKKP